MSRANGIRRSRVDLERICLKCLQKRQPDRYRSAEALLDDLEHWLITAGSGVPRHRADPPVRTRVKPKGLRSFDEFDSDFYLDLVPGPRDRDGLPERVRFWKSRIEPSTSDVAPLVIGVAYGPSGCGKSSLFKAGVLPRLSTRVMPIYVEAGPDGTEARLRGKLAERIPELDGSDSLTAMLRSLRGLQQPHPKVLIVLDQFEQWLHAQPSRFESTRSNRPLIDALRQCDGHNSVCILMVRDDFWLAVSRLMQELEVPLVEGENCRLVDTFDLQHARHVLRLLGRGYGRLTDSDGTSEDGNAAFIEQAIQELQENGSVACVRLSLLAEMMKDKPWTPATLSEVGGIRGVGVTFLEEIFASPTSPVEYRRHEKAARAVLEQLLPKTGSNIKGAVQSSSQLLQASGYAGRSGDFERLMQILDRDVRLLTPKNADDCRDHAKANPPTEKLYQLTHDYLVPCLREWLTRKRKETWTGRAELRLAERASSWSVSRPRSGLPTWSEYVGVRLLTRPERWTDREDRMMREAGRSYMQRAAVWCGLLVALALVGYQAAGRIRARAVADSLIHADVDSLPKLIAQVRANQKWAVPHLEAILRTEPQSSTQRREQLNARLALVASDTSACPGTGRRDDASRLRIHSANPRCARPAPITVHRRAMADLGPIRFDKPTISRRPRTRRIRAGVEKVDAGSRRIHDT